MITSAIIRNGMRQVYSKQEWAILWEVAKGTGASGSERRADAIMMSLWPSRGLELHGVEIKISKADWKREAKDPTKAETIAKYCDRWWVFTAPGVISDLAELPPAWGAREFDGKRWKTLREAQKTDAEPVSKEFLASLLRCAQKGAQLDAQVLAAEQIKSLENEKTNLRATHEAQIKAECDRRMRHTQQVEKNVEEFEAKSGIKITGDWRYSPEFGVVAGLLHKLLYRDGWSGVEKIIDEMIKHTNGIKGALEQLNPSKE